jgi:CubicO group peptidase (beta-lactamase class C family)
MGQSFEEAIIAPGSGRFRREYAMRFLVLLGVALGLTVRPVATAEDNHQKVDRIFADYNKPNSPGCAVGVIQDGDFVYRKGYGMGSLELGVPLASQSVFYMGSVSKQFTAASVVLAAEQGLLSLDDDVRKYVPELPDYGHVITLRQMLHHTSGLRDFLTLFSLAGKDVADVHSEAEIISMIGRQKALNNIPGDEYIYSNSNYYLLGVVVNRATKKTLNEFATDNIFKPLGMFHTRFYDDHTLVVALRVAAYDPGADGKFLVDWSTQYDIVGAGGLTSTVDDMILWDRNFYENKLGKGALLKEMQTRGVLNNGKQISYALGLEIDKYRGLPTVEHDGALYGYRTAILRFPEQKFSVVCLCNISSVSTSSLTHKVADVYLEKDLKNIGIASQSPDYSGAPDPSRFAGKYLDARKQMVYTFTAEGGNLKAWGAALRRVGPNQFMDLGTDLITFDAANGQMKATLLVNGEAFFDGPRVVEARLSEADLARYSGKYKSDELDATYTLSVKDGKLMLRNGWQPEATLTPLGDDEFESYGIGTVVFRRDGNHQSSGFGLYDGNVRNIAFERQN